MAKFVIIWLWAKIKYIGHFLSAAFAVINDDDADDDDSISLQMAKMLI